MDSTFLKWLPEFFDPALLVLEVFAISTITSVLLGSLVAIVRALGNRLVNTVLYLYVSIFRNTPLIVQLFFFFYVLPELGINLSPLLTGILGITLNEGAFMAEIFRGVISGISANDWEAAESIGLRRYQVLLYVIFPQAFRDAIPAISGQVSMILKDTSVLSLIMIIELVRVARSLYTDTFSSTGFYFAALLYILFFSAFSFFARWVEGRTRITR